MPGLHHLTNHLAIIDAASGAASKSVNKILILRQAGKFDQTRRHR